MAAHASIDQPSSPAPKADEPAIDLKHLSRMTLGERGLEREVLALFDRQAEILLPRIQLAEGPAAATFAHTLKGSARGIGAWRVAQAAEGVEQAAGVGVAAAVTALGVAIAETRAEIARLLLTH